MTGSGNNDLDLTLVLIEVAGGAAIASCLDSLMAFGKPCIAILREDQPELRSAYPCVHFEALAAPVPQRRKLGVELAQTKYLALIEDTGRPGAALIRGIERAFELSGCAAASGPVAISAALNPRHQALACTEYGRYHASQLFPLPGQGPLVAARLPGNFLVYLREPLLKALADFEQGLVEGALNARLGSQGFALVMCPDMTLEYVGGDDWGARLTTRFQHGRLYAGAVAEHKGLVGRLLQGMKSVLLPAVLSLRAIKNMRSIPTIRKPLQVAAWICLFELYWSAGELQGSLLGKPRDMEAWR